MSYSTQIPRRDLLWGKYIDLIKLLHFALPMLVGEYIRVF